MLKPRLVLRFGVTGHRPPRLDERLGDAIQSRCAGIFATAARVCDDIRSRNPDAFSDEAPRIELISCLAEGADVLVADAATQAGLDLVACLPLPEAEYAHDFSPAKWTVTERLLARARRRIVLECEFGSRTRAYEAAGRIVVAQCDILIAVWDGREAHGRGGAAQMVGEAIAADCPVIHVDAGDREEPALVWHSFHENKLIEQPGISLKLSAAAHLAEVIRALVDPPRGTDRDTLARF